MMEGRCQWWLGNRRLELAEGDWLLLTAGTWHRERVPGPGRARIAWLGFDCGGEADLASLANLPKSAGHWADELRHLLEVTFRESQRPELLGSRERVAGSLRSLLVLLARSAVGESGTESTPRGSQAVRAAAHTLVQNLSSPLRISALARYHGMSASRFAAAFREELGASPRDFVQQARLAEARRRLRDTRESVKEIAAACGYSDAAHFCHHFKTATAMSPLAWRRTLSSGT